MLLELRDLIADIAVHAGAVADSALSSLFALSAADAPNALDVGTLLVGGAAGGALGGGSMVGGGGGDRGFRYTGNDGTVRDSPSSDGTVVGDLPNGLRLIYDNVVRDANGTVTHYHVNQPGTRPGYIPAANTSDTPPTHTPQAPPSVLFPRDESDLRGIHPNTTGARG